MSVQLFKKSLTGSFASSAILMLSGQELTLFWTLVTSGGPTSVEFYLEFGDNITSWYQETDEQDTGVGVVKMSKAIRTFYENGGAGLGNGTHYLSNQFTRRTPFARIWTRVVAGVASATILSPSGEIPAVPAR